MKAQRQDRIAHLLMERPVASQSELVELLGESGIVATQATVSRDLVELGALKVRLPGGGMAYAIAQEAVPRPPEGQLRRLLAEFALAVTPSGNLALVRTPPGSAHVVASAIDRAQLDGVLGTVAGDDTLLVVCDEAAGGVLVAGRLRQLAGLEEEPGRVLGRDGGTRRSAGRDDRTRRGAGEAERIGGRRGS